MKTSAATNNTRKITGRNNSNDDGKDGNGRNGNGNGKASTDSQLAVSLWLRLENSINKLIQKIINYNSFMSHEDYMQEAYFACLDAVQLYEEYMFKGITIESVSSFEDEDGPASSEETGEQRMEVGTFMSEVNGAIQGGKEKIAKLRRQKKTRMKPEVFAYWIIQKHLHRVANRNEVVFHVYDDYGEYIKTVSNSEYRKMKKEITENRLRITSSNIMKDLEFRDDDGETNENRQYKEFIDHNFIGFNEEVKELLEEDLKRYKYGEK